MNFLVDLPDRLDKAFSEARARALVTRNPDPAAPWREVVAILAAERPLAAVFAALTFRDSLVADEGLHEAAAFMDYLLEAADDGGDGDA